METLKHTSTGSVTLSWLSLSKPLSDGINPLSLKHTSTGVMLSLSKCSVTLVWKGLGELFGAFPKPVSLQFSQGMSALDKCIMGGLN